MSSFFTVFDRSALICTLCTLHEGKILPFPTTSGQKKQTNKQTNENLKAKNQKQNDSFVSKVVKIAQVKCTYRIY